MMITTKTRRERKPPPTTTFQPKVIRDSQPDFRINPNPDPDVLLDLSQNTVDVLSCRRQSFSQIWYESGVDCIRNANKCPKIPYSAMVKKMKKNDPEFTRGSGSPLKVNHF